MKNCYQQDDNIFINFEDGHIIKHFIKSKETVKISANKEIVEHMYPDNSVVVDSKETKLKHINNKYGIEATFDLQGNKFMDKDVKSHFR